jgi:putative SOS response-associated peptidase YedK
MCGRYYIEIDEKELQDIAGAVEKNIKEYPEQTTIKFSGEIFPTDIVPVQTGLKQYQAMKWGFSGFDGRPLINARSETALEKPLFRQSMLARRCLILASGYYEWKTAGTHKTKYRFFTPGYPLYLAGCYRQESSSQLPRFVILTRQADGNMAAIHARMPVIIPQKYRQTWLNEGHQCIDYALRNLTYEAV